MRAPEFNSRSSRFHLAVGDSSSLPWPLPPLGPSGRARGGAIRSGTSPCASSSSASTYDRCLSVRAIGGRPCQRCKAAFDCTCLYCCTCILLYLLHLHYLYLSVASTYPILLSVGVLVFLFHSDIVGKTTNPYFFGEPHGGWDRFLSELEDSYWEDYRLRDCCAYRRSRPYSRHTVRSWCFCKFKKGRFFRSCRRRWARRERIRIRRG